MKDVESSIPHGWEWKSGWSIRIEDDSTDQRGWSYAVDWYTDFHASKNLVLHNVRQRRWLRTRRLIEQSKKGGRVKKRRRPKPIPTSPHAFDLATLNPIDAKALGYHVPAPGEGTTDDSQKSKALESVSVARDRGGSDDRLAAHEASEERRKRLDSALDDWDVSDESSEESAMEDEVKTSEGIASLASGSQPPLKIVVTWRYHNICRAGGGKKKNRTYFRRRALSVWRPDFEHTSLSGAVLSDEVETVDVSRKFWYTGHLALDYELDSPDGVVPFLLFEKGSDHRSLARPEALLLESYQKVHTGQVGFGKELGIGREGYRHRYWFSIIPPEDYVALGGICLELSEEDKIPSKCLPDHAYQFLIKKLPLVRKFGLKALACVHRKYVTDSHPFDPSAVYTESSSGLKVLRPSPVVVVGVHKPVEMAMQLKKSRKSSALATPRELERNSDAELLSSMLGPCVKQNFIDVAAQARLHSSLASVVESPLVITYASDFHCVWNSSKITETSNTKCSIWEPILGRNEFMLGHLCVPDWIHPLALPRPARLVIVKMGGTDPDAFKQPLAFECVWSANEPRDDHHSGSDREMDDGLRVSRDSSVFSRARGSSMAAMSAGAHTLEAVGSVVTGSALGSRGLPPGSFWRAIPPAGYKAVGDIALDIDGHVGSRKIGATLQPYEFPKYVCIKNEYVSKIESMFVKMQKSKADPWSSGADAAHSAGRRKSVLAGGLIETKLCKVCELLDGESQTRNRDLLWDSQSCHALKHNHGSVYGQPPITADIMSPMLAVNGLEPRIKEDCHPSILPECVTEDEPAMQVLKSGFVWKKGKEVLAAAKKRFFILSASDKQLKYYDGYELKGVIDLGGSKGVECKIDGSPGTSKKWKLQTSDSRKFDFRCDSATDTIEWVKMIGKLTSDSISKSARSSSGSAIISPGMTSPLSRVTSTADTAAVDGSDAFNEIDIHGGATLEEQITELLSNRMKQLTEHLEHCTPITTDVVTDTSNDDAIDWYERLENMKTAIEVLLDYWGLGVGSSADAKRLAVGGPSSVKSKTDEASSSMEEDESEDDHPAAPDSIKALRENLESLMARSAELMIKDIRHFSKQEAVNLKTSVRLHRACSALSETKSGQTQVCEFITSELLKASNEEFAAGRPLAGLRFISKRFAEYKRVMREYSRRFEPLIPLWWDLGMQLASQYVATMTAQLDEQLTSHPESSDQVISAKQQCTDFEKDLILDGLKRTTYIEIDCRSWTNSRDVSGALDDPTIIKRKSVMDGDIPPESIKLTGGMHIRDDGTDMPISWIKVDNKDFRVPGSGISAVAVDLYTHSVVYTHTFDFTKDTKRKKQGKLGSVTSSTTAGDGTAESKTDGDSSSSAKKSGGVRRLSQNQKFVNFVQSIRDDMLLVLVSHDYVGFMEDAVKLELTKYGLNSDTDLPKKNESFIFVGRRSRLTSDHFYFKEKKLPHFARPLHFRYIVKPVIPDEMILANIKPDMVALPFYDGILVSVLERHLETFVQAESDLVRQVLSQVKSEETLKRLISKKWIARIDSNSDCFHQTIHFQSVIDISKAMKTALENIKQVTIGNPLAQLIEKFNELLILYCQILEEMLMDAGGSKAALASDFVSDRFVTFLSYVIRQEQDRLGTGPASSSSSTMYAPSVTVGSDKVPSMWSLGYYTGSTKKQRRQSDGIQTSSIKDADFSSENWNMTDVQNFLLYAGMIFNTCRETRALLHTLEEKTKKVISEKFLSRVDCSPAISSFLHLEQCIINLISVSILSRFDVIFDFDGNASWNEKTYSTNISDRLSTYLLNPRKILPLTVFEYLLKNFACQFSLQFMKSMILSKRLKSATLESGHSILMDLCPLIEASFLKQFAAPMKSRSISESKLKIWHAFVSRCLKPPSAIVKLAFANAGDKYDPLAKARAKKAKEDAAAADADARRATAAMADGSRDSSIAKRVPSAPPPKRSSFWSFGRSSKPATPVIDTSSSSATIESAGLDVNMKREPASLSTVTDDSVLYEEYKEVIYDPSALATQIEDRTVSEIAKTQFARNAVEFCNDPSFALDPFKRLPSYSALFGDGVEIDGDGAASSSSSSSSSSTSASPLDDVPFTLPLRRLSSGIPDGLFTALSKDLVSEMSGSIKSKPRFVIIHRIMCQRRIDETDRLSVMILCEDYDDDPELVEAKLKGKSHGLKQLSSSLDTGTRDSFDHSPFALASSSAAIAGGPTPRR